MDGMKEPFSQCRQLSSFEVLLPQLKRPDSRLHGGFNDLFERSAARLRAIGDNIQPPLTGVLAER